MIRIRSLISIAANATTTIFCPDFISNGIIKKGSSNMVLSLSLGIRSVGMRPYRALGSMCIVSVVAPIVMVTGYFMKALEANK